MKVGCSIMPSVLNFFLMLGTAALASGQEGFMNVDCGLPRNSNSTNEIGLVYVPDDEYIDTGINKQVHPAFLSNSTIYNTLRSFPDYNRNCYNLTPVIKGKRYLLRALFMYGNHDGKSMPPTFDLYVGPDIWYTVKLDNSSHILSTEITAQATSASMYVCLVKTTEGTPFISGLELRQLNDDIFTFVSRSLSLVTIMCISAGGTTKIRYPDDHYDRIWMPATNSYGTSISTTLKVQENASFWFDLPSSVLQTAATSSSDIKINWAAEPDSTFHFFMHFVELIQLPANETRNMTIYKNGGYFFGPFSPTYLISSPVYTTTTLKGASHYLFTISVPKSSVPGPLLNGFQLYKVVQLAGVATSIQDVTAITAIKEYYGIKRNWRADPCVPQNYQWDGVECDNYISSPRIVSLDLSNSGLNGTISNSFVELSEIRSLNLSGNQLQGSIPPFLAGLTSLTSLDLSSNVLTGKIPSSLQQRVNDDLLFLRVENNSQLCQDRSCNQSGEKGNKMVTSVLIIISCASSIAAVVLIFVIVKMKFRAGKKKGTATKQKDSLESESNQAFTYDEVVGMTNNFEKVIGKGGSGMVYYGCLKSGVEVAVKMLGVSMPRGIKEFASEVKLLMRIHHKDLVSLVGFCEEGANLILMYEYMSKGNLRKLLADGKLIALTWRKRLQIAISAATGLDYLHSGCRPPIIHRDVKTSNILLNEKLEAKLSDFGLSRAGIIDETTCVETAVAGTPGYIDPEYYNTNKLTKKSDVYSFGVVLLELISGRPAIITENERIHIIQWASPKLSEGDVQSVADPRLQGQVNSSSLQIVAEIAIKCTAQTANMRPTMAHVLNTLK